MVSRQTSPQETLLPCQPQFADVGAKRQFHERLPTILGRMTGRSEVTVDNSDFTHFGEWG
jgi:hypothetical protein